MLQSFFECEEFKEFEKALLAFFESVQKDFKEYMKNHDITKEGDFNK